ncbi:hypothetical protein DFH07DRAFT_847586 [Mycena maculata]|uniref:Fungal-type protein kinase domain-containing protein n=1 Tax=Mycena maculata TaxID=230809 RepID=A0AAD7HZA6_9AGAR|nr:hypothetical protein DFH07DRAFT_847586 [Mycena maculata]
MTSHIPPTSRVSFSSRGPLESTPRKPKTHSNSQYAAKAEVSKQSNPAQMNRWKERVIQGYSRAVSVADFFSMHMTGDVPFPRSKITQIATKSKVQLNKTATKIKKNTIELKMYDTFIDYVRTVVQDFPSATKPTFTNTSGVTFKRLHPTDHDSRPDVSSPLPGFQAPEVWEWHHTGTVIEFKVKDDPFEADGSIKSGQLGNLVQLLKNARCILMSSGCCYTFVVSVFRNRARLFRVDRSGYIVTDSFDWSTEDQVFPEFYWRLYNGVKGGWLLGHDTTISFPTPTEKVAMHAKLQKIPEYSSLRFEEATATSRWVEVRLHGKQRRAFTVGEPIFQSKGLFGRGTRVDRVLIEGDEPPQMYAMKDAWRQACRRPESNFYTVIQDYFDKERKDEAPRGLATCVGSVDLSTLYSGHKTITAGLRADGDPRLDRCHDRSLFTPVGFTLEGFQSTKQMVQALRNAIAGHQLAFLAGVLHRDISAGNVLINEAQRWLSEAGFLLDFDYSEFTEEGLARFKSLYPGVVLEEVDKNLKEITGTYPFMSLASLNQLQLGASHPDLTQHRHSCRDDLEGFYWLLIWLILRHTDHGDPQGANACSNVFDGEILQVVNQKTAWLSSISLFPTRPRLPVKNHSPLTRLVDVLTPMFRGHYTSPPVDVTHGSLLTAFDEVLRADGWPENDAAQEFLLPHVDLDRMPPPLLPNSASIGSGHGSRGSTNSYWRLAVQGAKPVPRTQEDGAASDTSSLKRKRAAGESSSVAPDGQAPTPRRSRRLRRSSM